MNPPTRVPTQQGNQKFVFVTQRPQTPGGTSQPNASTQQNTVVKFVSNNTGQTQQKLAGQQKLVVVSNPMTQTNFSTQSSGLMSPTSQPPAMLISKPNFTIQQQQQQQQQMQPPSVDDLSHLA